MSDETDIYNSSDPGGGGGGDVRIKILDNFKFSPDTNDAARPLSIENGVLECGGASYQFSPVNPFDISTSNLIELGFKLKSINTSYCPNFLSNWYQNGDAFALVRFRITNSVARVEELHTANSSSSVAFRGTVPDITGSDFLNNYHDILFTFDIQNGIFKFKFDDQEKSISCVYPYKNLWAPGFGCSYSSLNAKGIASGMSFDLKNMYLKIDGSTVWGNEE